MKVDQGDMEDPELNVSSLIDMVFLLLVYFMSVATFMVIEGDLGIKLPGMLQQADAVDLPDEQIIEIRANGSIFLNDKEFDDAFSVQLPELTATLIKYKKAADASKNEAMITINADDDTPHQRVINVLDACAFAGVTNVTFAGAAAEGEE